MADMNKVLCNTQQDLSAEQKLRAQQNIGADLQDGGALTDAASIDVPNNAVSTLTSAQSALTLNVKLAAGEVPNFAVEITASANITLTITATLNNVATTLKYASSAGNALESGKFYQIICIGSCWTLAEFIDPSANS